MKFLFLVLILVAVSQARNINDEETTLQAARATMDPKEVVTIGDRLYYVNTIVHVNVGLAATLCNDLGMVLVSFETLDEYHLVRDWIIKNEKTDVFYITSGNEYNDRWIWSGSGQIITEFEWANWNPDDPPEYDSSILFHVYDGWFDLYNDAGHYFVCEQK